MSNMMRKNKLQQHRTTTNYLNDTISRHIQTPNSPFQVRSPTRRWSCQHSRRPPLPLHGHLRKAHHHQTLNEILSWHFQKGLRVEGLVVPQCPDCPRACQADLRRKTTEAVTSNIHKTRANLKANPINSIEMYRQQMRLASRPSHPRAIAKSRTAHKCEGYQLCRNGA